MFAAILAGATKTGRRAVGHTGRTAGRAAKNAATSGYAATEWRTPGKALEHHAGRAGAGGRPDLRRRRPQDRTLRRQTLERPR